MQRSNGVFVTDLASRPIVKLDIVTFDLAGFKLGMSAAEVERVARLRHLQTGMSKRLIPFADALPGDRMPSFETRAQLVAAERLHKAPPAPERVLRQVLLRDAEGNNYDLRFLAAEGGPSLYSLAYSTTMNGNDPATYKAALQTRYGLPQRARSASNLSASWCYAADPTCEKLPSLTVNSNGATVNFYLQGGSKQFFALEERISARGAQIAAGSAHKPSF